LQGGLETGAIHYQMLMPPQAQKAETIPEKHERFPWHYFP
jgi:hypothetical protein